jgi:small-conductance mechanosensitive channel
LIALKLSPYELILAVTVFSAVLGGLLIVKAFIARQLRRLALRQGLELLGYPEHIVNATRFPFLCGVALLAAISQLDLTPHYDKLVHFAWIIVLVSQVALWANEMVSVWVQRAFARHREINPSGATHLMVAGLVARIVLWSIATLVTLDNLGFNISTLMASLGIGGIAVALAVQNILGDVFSSVSIALDKPFVIGDFIVVDSYMGTVEYVGLKTTRIRSLGGEQIVFSNTELLKNRIRNYKRMQERRVQFEFGIAYETATEDIERIPAMVRTIITDGVLDTRFDRAHFKAYGDSALLFEVVYYVLVPDYNKYMDIQQTINLELLRQFRKRGITFAYPTQTLYIASNAPAETPAPEPAPRRVGAASVN